MSDLAQKVPDVRVDWSSERESRVLGATHRRWVRRGRVRRMAFVALSGVALAVLFVVFRSTSLPHDSGAPVVLARAPSVVRTVILADGSVAERLDNRARLRVIDDTPSLSVVELETGTARFDVKHNPSRPFRVRAGSVLVEVLGTKFTVSRENGTVTTSVERGHVRMERGAELVDLYAGNVLTLPEVAEPPPSLTVPSPAPAASADSALRVHPPARSAPAGEVGENWAGLARQGEFERAYDAMKTSTGVRKDDPAELLLAADVARLSGHSSEAIAPLSRIVDEYARDARAPLAAFTLGRVLLDEVGRPNEAADMFARTRALAPNGPLAEDALAREVEAWWRVGNADRAHTRASEYVKLFPSGAKLKSVRRFGGLD